MSTNVHNMGQSEFVWSNKEPTDAFDRKYSILMDYYVRIPVHANMVPEEQGKVYKRQLWIIGKCDCVKAIYSLVNTWNNGRTLDHKSEWLYSINPI